MPEEYVQIKKCWDNSEFHINHIDSMSGIQNLNFNNFLEYEVGDVIFEEYPALCIPRDRDYACFHCALPLESINEAASRLSKNKHELFEMMPMNKK